MKKNTLSVKKNDIVHFLVTVNILIYPISVITLYKIFYISTFVTFAILASIKLKAMTHIVLMRSKLVNLLFATFFLSSLWSVSTATTFISALTVTIYLIAYYNFCIWCREVSYEKIFNTFNLLVFVVTLINCYLLVRYGSIRPLDKIMKAEIGSYSNVATALMVSIIPYTLCQLKQSLHLKNISILIMIIINILIAQSRAGFLLLGVIIVLSVIMMSGSMSKRFVTLFSFSFIMVIVIVGLYSVKPELILQPVERITKIDVGIKILELPEKNEEDYQRRLMYYLGIQSIRENIVLGIGFGSLKEYIIEHGYIGKKSHNIIITLWNCGLIALMVFVILISKTILTLLSGHYQYRKSDANISGYYVATAISLVGIILHAMVRPQLEMPLTYFPIAVALFIKINNQRTKQVKYFTAVRLKKIKTI